MKFLGLAFRAGRLALMRFGAGWMFALLTFNFNRIAIHELGAIALVVTSLIGLHHFLSFFQVIWGRFADRHPLFGYRRSPYILISSLVASLVFLALPSVAIGLGDRSPLAMLAAAGLLFVFGIAMAANGTSSNSLVAEVTTPKERGGVIAVVWTFVILSGIVSAGVAKSIMPEYSPERMQFLYNLTPAVVMTAAVLGLIGMERRISREEHQALMAEPRLETAPMNTLRLGIQLMRTNSQVRGFFAFVLLSIMGIFLQDAILEVFGAEVFNMTVAETTSFQQMWGGGVLLGMLGMGILSMFLPLSKKLIASIGGLSIAFGLGGLAVSSFTLQQGLIVPALFVMGIGTGLFNVGALSMMMEMTVDGFVGLYMGLWGMAQGLGNGFANIFSGGLHTGLIESNLLSPATAYTLIFGLEALVMVVAIGVLRSISVQRFKGLTTQDLGRTLALDTAGD
ncbi:BCD family MFS transporter [Candidatus Gracilibacteria bacterium]|nr:BCD family MFS transporter [Candidatus Gracilibacteria bacterium]